MKKNNILYQFKIILVYVTKISTIFFSLSLQTILFIQAIPYQTYVTAFILRRHKLSANLANYLYYQIFFNSFFQAQNLHVVLFPILKLFLPRRDGTSSSLNLLVQPYRRCCPYNIRIGSF